jgi:hypothetical protein
MTTETTGDTEASPEPVEAVPADGAWAVIQLMGHKTIAGRVSPDLLLGGGTVLVETPEPDGVTLRKRQSFHPSTGLYLASYYSRQEVIDHLYPPVRHQLELTRGTQVEQEDEEDDQESLFEGRWS